MTDLQGWGGQQEAECMDCGCNGGVVQTVAIPFCEIEDIVISDACVITSIVLKNPDKAALYFHDNTNDASFYNQTGETINNLCKQTQQSFSGEVYCMNAEAIKEANRIDESGKMVLFHEMENGLILVQGIDICEDPLVPGTFFWRLQKRPILLVSDIIGGTGAESVVVRLRAEGTSRKKSAVTSMSIAQLAAL